MPRALDIQRLVALGLLRKPERAPQGKPTLAQLCASGVLEGGLSVALDVRPDELVGPLCQRIGGQAQTLRVVDARTRPPELWVRLLEGREEVWPTPDVAALVAQLNNSYRKDTGVRAIANLGQWEGEQQLWCISKQTLPALLKEGLLQAENLAELSALLVQPARLTRSAPGRRGR